MSPRESGGTNTGHEFPEPFDPEVVFTHDLSPELRAASLEHLRESVVDTVREAVAPRRVAGCADTIPALSATIASSLLISNAGWCSERLGFTPDEMDGGHLPALARPDELVDRLEGYRAELDIAPSSAVAPAR